MIKHLLLLLLLLLHPVYSIAQITGYRSLDYISHIEIYIVYDNNAYRRDLVTDWGLSIYIKTGSMDILFDTGGNGSILLYNMEKLGIDPRGIDVVVISHHHMDHVGGLYTLLEINQDIVVYIPYHTPDHVKEGIKSRTRNVIEVKEPLWITKGILVSGEMSSDGVYEESLFVVTRYGVLVFTGCAHPGVDRIVSRAIELTGKHILLVGGGFHLMGASKDKIKSIIDVFKKYGVEYVMPIHCSGDPARQLFKEAYGDKCLLAGVGYYLTLQDLIETQTIQSTTNMTTTEGIYTTINTSRPSSITPMDPRILMPAIILITTLIIIITFYKRTYR